MQVKMERNWHFTYTKSRKFHNRQERNKFQLPALFDVNFLFFRIFFSKFSVSGKFWKVPMSDTDLFLLLSHYYYHKQILNGVAFYVGLVYINR